MDKQAFFDSYIKKDKIRQHLEEVLTDPKLRLASRAPQVLGTLGAGVGALAAGYLGPKEKVSDPVLIPGIGFIDDGRKKKRRRVLSLKAIVLGSMLGGTAGSFAGTAIKDRVKWSKIRSLMNNV